MGKIFDLKKLRDYWKTSSHSWAPRNDYTQHLDGVLKDNVLKCSSEHKRVCYFYKIPLGLSHILSHMYIDLS